MLYVKIIKITAKTISTDQCNAAKQDQNE